MANKDAHHTSISLCQYNQVLVVIAAAGRPPIELDAHLNPMYAVSTPDYEISEVAVHECCLAFEIALPTASPPNRLPRVSPSCHAWANDRPSKPAPSDTVNYPPSIGRIDMKTCA